MKLSTLLIAAVVLAASSCSRVELPGRDETGGTQQIADELTLADAQATAATKALYRNLWAIADKGFMFGHQDDLMYGRYWYGQEGKSDTKAVCGDYPAVMGIDLSTLIDDRYADNPSENELRLRCIRQAYDLGMVVIVCLHLDNPLTVAQHREDKDYSDKKGGAWDNSSSKVVAGILDSGSEVHRTFYSWLDRLADIAKNLKGSDGEQIPIILRPFHEHTQSWSWWGTSCCTESEFVRLWQGMVSYLSDTKGVHNLIYAISPQMDSQKTDEDFLFRWPGDEWVDFIGMDCYQGINNAVFTANLKAISRVSIAKKKPCGVTETGVESFTKKTYWTENIYAPMCGRRVSLLVTWRNKFVSSESDKHFFSVYPGHPSEDDFRKMYRAEETIFCSDLPDMYR